MWDYDEAHCGSDGQVGGQPRKLITHSARKRIPPTPSGQTLLAKT